jgi:hypothetical protein
MTERRRNPAFPRMISDFVRLRTVDLLAPREVESLRAFLIQVFQDEERLPSRGSGINWQEIAARCEIDPEADKSDDFHAASRAELASRGETLVQLRRDLQAAGHRALYSTLRMWRIGQKAPSNVDHLAVLKFLEERWGLPEGYFRSRLPHPSRAMRGHTVSGIGQAERRRLAWHLPDDFDRRPLPQQEEILEWVRLTIVSGTTDCPP